MKKVAIATWILLIAFLYPNEETYGQKREQRKITAFTEVSYNIPGKLYLKQGSSPALIIEGDEDELERIVTEVKGEKLSIKTKDNDWRFWKDAGDVTIYLTVTTIEEINVNGSGEVIGEGTIKSSNLGLNVNGSGDAELDVQLSGDLKSNISGSGNIDLKGVCQNYKTSISGSGKFKGNIKVSNDSHVSIAGSGEVNLSGSTKQLTVHIAGSGDLKGVNFVTNICNVNIAGSGGVEVTVNDELEVNIGGSGDVAYKGNPSKVNSKSNGSGSVRKI